VNENEIRRAISILHPNNSLFEIRAIDDKWNASGYFTSADKVIEQLQVAKIKPKAQLYITLNQINAACYGRTQHDVFVEYPKETTSDSNIDGYRWLMVDLDPKRPTGISSSDEELEAAKKVANDIYAYMKHEGWYDPVIAMSGNGVHLLYSVLLKNIEERKELMKRALVVLNALFSTDMVDVDVKTFNPARICKLYGTMAKKGANTPERPHRESYIQSVPDKLRANDITLLQKLASVIPTDPPKPEKYNSYNPRSFNLDEWIEMHNLPVKKKETWAGGEKWVLEYCVFDPSHKGKDAAIIRTNDGKICYNCFHNSCANNHWRELRLKYEPDAYKEYKEVDASIKPNHTTAKLDTQTVHELPPFLTTEQIRNMDKPNEEFLQSGITIIDKKMRGLKKGFVTCISGLRGCGKSSIISEISLNVINNGFKVALFSGELTAKNVQKWLTLQAAGKSHVVATQYENYYTFSEETLKKISIWMNGKIFVYNNDYGNSYDEIEMQLQKCIIDNKVDLVILDNLMSMNLSKLSTDKYQQQSCFVERLEILAKQYNVHIIFVAHPRKSQGFLRLEDVSGSNDIVNRVDNAFIMHRVNDDFRRLTAEMYRWKSSNPIYQASNVIEICKDRDGGLQDMFIPLFFEIETKRLKNSLAENIIYGWQNEWDGEGELPPF
jgi:archaellum biogenesis ATPase FlaH